MIQILLVAGQPVQTASIYYSAPADSIVPRVLPPIRPDSVTVDLIAPDGSRIPFEPTVGLTTRFEANRTVLPGESYLLLGMVAGLEVSATVTVPGPLDVRRPIQDTLTLPSTAGQVLTEFAWYAPGAASYVARQRDDNGLVESSFATRDTTGILRLSPFFGDRADTTSLAIWAYDQSATAFFLGRGHAVVSDPGAIIGFGAATPAATVKTIIWQAP